jgi:uncharacterized protein YegP (UPF0339 family)
VPAKFVVKKGTTGKFRFNLLSTNGKADLRTALASARNGSTFTS